MKKHNIKRTLNGGNLTNLNNESFEWTWPAAGVNVKIDYNSKITKQAMIIGKIWISHSFDEFKSWAQARNINVTVTKL